MISSFVPTPSSPAIQGIRSCIGSLSDRAQALIRRHTVSQSALEAELPSLGAGVHAAGRGAAVFAREIVSEAGKALENAAEEARVRAAQLGAYAALLEEEGGPAAGAEALAQTLLLSSMCVDAAGFVVIDWDSASLSRAVVKASRVRDGVHASLCVVSGDGISSYQVGDNSVSVAAVDTDGDGVETIEAGDACVSVEGAALASVTVGEAGLVEVVYRVQEGSVAPVTLAMSVCGVMRSPAGSPWMVTRLLGDSGILATIGPAQQNIFLHTLSAWLPSRAYTLLYRGSRDGMTARAFHGLCDGKGPTLVLVRCDKGWVFGGYAGASWETGRYGNFVASAEAFLFSVTGPYTADPVRFPVREEYATEALWCPQSHGPVFCDGLYLVSNEGVTSCFDDESCCFIGEGYEDVIGKGRNSLTGDMFFMPVELEVYAVTRI